MAIQLSGRRPKGNDAAALRKWGMIFLALGVVGRCVLQNRILGIGTVSTDELLAAMQADMTITIISAMALVCQIAETCAAPLFAFLLVEGFLHTSSFEKYLLRVVGVALISEIPYNLAYSGKLLDLSSRNPAFGLLIGLVMLFFFNRYAEKSTKNLLMKALIAVASFLWCLMLGIEHGICLVVLVGFLWIARDKSNFRAMLGFCAAMFCSMFNMMYMGACLSVIMLHRYSEERGEQNEKLNYAFYPALLLIVGIVAKFI